MSIDDKYYAFDVSTKQSVNLSDKILSKFHEKFMVIQNIMKKFKYADDGNEMKESINFNEINTNINNISKNEIITDYKNINWINEFNNENFIKSVELQETIANSVLTSNYFTLRLS